MRIAIMRTKTVPQTGETLVATPKRGRNGQDRAQPLLGQHSPEVQTFGTVTRMPIGLDEEVRRASAEALNQLLVDTMTLCDLYKKHHWQVSGPTFYSLHL